MISAVRQKYWPLNGRNIARSVVHHCIKCFEYKPVVFQPIMGDLPEARVRPTRAFKRTGVDFAGPFMIKSSLRRNAPLNKAYSCLFVCFITKAVYVELVGDLTHSSVFQCVNGSVIDADCARTFIPITQRISWAPTVNSKNYKCFYIYGTSGAYSGHIIQIKYSMALYTAEVTTFRRPLGSGCEVTESSFVSYTR